MSRMFIPGRNDNRSRRAPSSLYADIVPPGVNLLVVDINRACLAVTEAKLLRFGYSVITARGVEEASSILEDKSNDVHLVLAEAYFPGVERFEALEKLGQKFDMAVIILSDDEDDYVMLEAISRGAYFYLVKPIAEYEVRNLWQFALAKKREEWMARRLVKSKPDATASAKALKKDHNRKGEDDHGDSTAEASTGELQGRKRAIEEEESGEGDGEDSSVEKQKKPKVTWTSALHERFLKAIKALGPEKARPRKILQHMNMPGLRKEHVASHLQKYRIFLRKGEEESLQNESFLRTAIPLASSSAEEIGCTSLLQSSLMDDVTKIGRVFPEISREPFPANYRVPESFNDGIGIEHGRKNLLLGSDMVAASGSEVLSSEPPSWAAPEAKAQDAVEYSDDDMEQGMMEMEELVRLLDDSDDPDIN